MTCNPFAIAILKVTDHPDKIKQMRKSEISQELSKCDTETQREQILLKKNSTNSFFFFWLHSLWDPSSPSRDRTNMPAKKHKVFTTGLPGKSCTNRVASSRVAADLQFIKKLCLSQMILHNQVCKLTPTAQNPSHLPAMAFIFLNG